MPRSRRRAGVRKGKALRQMAAAAYNRRKRQQQADHAATMKRRADEQAARFAAHDKYANYPGNRP